MFHAKTLCRKETFDHGWNVLHAKRRHRKEIGKRLEGHLTLTSLCVFAALREASISIFHAKALSRKEILDHGWKVLNAKWRHRKEIGKRLEGRLTHTFLCFFAAPRENALANRVALIAAST